MAGAILRSALLADAGAVTSIYNHYIRTTVATFDEAEYPADEFRQRIEAAAQRQLPWLVLETADGVGGFACASPWKNKSAYRFVVETSIYLKPELAGQGHGLPLYARLLDELRQAGIKQAVACISLPNPGSVALHEKLGYQKAGEFPKVGLKFDRWIDVGYWQKAL